MRAALHDATSPLLIGGVTGDFGSYPKLPVIQESGNISEPTRVLTELASSQAPVHVFTSGTTKMPERRTKRWKALIGGAGVTEEILARLDLASPTTALLGTTPHQHMYGLEATVFHALGYRRSVYGSAIFFPADIETTIADVHAAGFENTVLVTSPAHLKFLEPALLEQKEIRAVISATAPLSRSQAERLEARGDLAVMEIYGSTETGALAIRRTIDGEYWEPVAGFEVAQSAKGLLATAPHVPEQCELGDTVELLADGRFRLIGRSGDMINIAGKRSNLAALNSIVAEMPCLLDSVVFRESDNEDDQLAIAAVLDPCSGMSPTEGKAAIRQQFLDHVDAVFIPRRIYFTDRLPRTPTGKIDVGGFDELRRRVSQLH